MIATSIMSSRIASCDAALRRSGATCTFVSDSGSRYFELPGSRSRVRVSDHSASGNATADDRWDAEILVDLPDWRDLLNQIVGPGCPSIGNVPASVYFADYESWSQSMLKTFLDRRRLAEAYYVLGIAQEPPDTSPTRKGTATHTALLEPHRLDRYVVGWPDGLLSGDGGIRSNAAKKYRDEVAESGRVLLKPAELASVKAMAESVRRVCGKWLSLPGFLEEAVYWTDEETGLACKCRLDWRITTDNANIILDLKTGSDASPTAFRQRVKSNRYWLQNAQYRRAGESLNGLPTQFYFVAVEDTFPHSCALHRLDDKASADADDALRSTLIDVAECLRTGDWSEPWESTINALDLKPWDFNPL